MDVLDPFDVKVRLGYLSTLEDNWYDGVGKAPDSKLLSKFGEYFGEYYDSALALPSIFPKIEGNIELEWVFSNTSIFLEVLLSDFSAELLISNSNDTFEELTLDLNGESNWSLINEKIKNIING